MLLVLCVVMSVTAVRLSSGQLVTTPRGTIRGVRADNGQYTEFLGIPYAVVDLTNPFGPSTAHPGFDSIFEANDDSVICPQVHSGVATGSVQCLNLNVFVPNTASQQNKLPVMVWIHGGSFIFGSGTKLDYLFEDLVRHDVVSVSINYRLGPYGFFCVDDPNISGNQGLKDQILAFKWIQENIESFGGDSSKITLFGESAGGISIEIHSLLEHKTLFHQGIVMSGSVFIPGAVARPDNSFPIYLASRLGLETQNYNEAISFLARQDPRLVVNLTRVEAALGFKNLPLTYGPCKEIVHEGVDVYLSDSPKDLDFRRAINIPLMHGVTSREMLIIHALITPELYEESGFEFFLKVAFNITDTDMLQDVTRFYIGDQPFTEDILEDFVDFASDYSFNFPMERSVRSLLEAGHTNVYSYIFSYEGGLNLIKNSHGITAPGAVHGDELGYLLGTDVYPIAPEDQLIVDRMTTLWTNFAKFGNPSPVVTELLPVVLTPVTANTRPHIDIDSDLRIKSRPFHDRLGFWNLVYQVYAEHEIINNDRNGSILLYTKMITLQSFLVCLLARLFV